MAHLSFEQLLTLAEGEQPEQPTHLQRCTRCSDELEHVRRMLATLRRAAGPEPSQAQLRRAEALYTRQRGGLRQRLRRLLASLSHDSGGLAPALAGVRGAAAPARQLLYASELLELDLAHAAAAPHELRGQLLPLPGQPHDLGGWRSLRLVPGQPGETLLGRSDAEGSFCFEAVPPGRWELVVELGDCELGVPLDLSASAPDREGPAES